MTKNIQLRLRKLTSLLVEALQKAGLPVAGEYSEQIIFDTLCEFFKV